MNLWVPALGTLLGVVVTGLVAWAVARHSASGSVESSDAATVFGQQNLFINTTLGEAVRLQAEVATLRKDVISMFEESLACRAEVATLKEQSAEARADNHRLRTQIVGLQSELAVFGVQPNGDDT